MSAKRPPDPLLLRVLAFGLALLFLGAFVLLPLVSVFAEAFAKGVGPYLHALTEDSFQSAIALTLLTAAVSVPLNVVFGVAAAWLVTRFEFRGKSLLVSLIDLPFSISPIIAGMVFVLLFGRLGVFGPWLKAHDIKIIFAVPGIVLATTFVTFPFVARELIPILEAQGKAEEEAALTLGANGFQTFFRITVPKIRWGLFYGVILCNARAIGEFGAVSVVSGAIRGSTTTVPLLVEMLYQDRAYVGAFAAASVLTLLAGVTLILKKIFAWKIARSRKTRVA